MTCFVEIPYPKYVSEKSHTKRSLLCPNPDASVMHSPGARPKTPIRYGTPKKSAVIRDPRTGKGKRNLVCLAQSFEK